MRLPNCLRLESRMKKLIFALTVLSAFVFLSACSGESPTPVPPTAVPPTDVPTVASNPKTPTLVATESNVCAPGQQPEYITDVVLAKDTQGANFEPVDITDSYTPTQQTFHAVVTLQNAPKNLQLGSTWYLVQAAGYKPQKIDANTLEVADGGSRNVDFTLKGTQPEWPAGDYCVEIYDGDTLAVSKPFTVAASDAPSNAGPSVITDIVLAEDTKPDTFDPINPTTEFKKNAAAIHAAVQITDAPANTLFKALWYPPDQEPLEFNLPPVDGTRWLDFRLTPTPDGFPAGEYKVEIYVNGTLADTKTFTVK